MQPGRGGAYASWFGGQAPLSALRRVGVAGCPDLAGPALSVALPFGTDAAGRALSLGGVMAPLQGYFNRARVVVMAHTARSHGLAIPWVLTGLNFGNPRGFGTAAAVERRFGAVPGGSGWPNAYVVWADAQVGAGDNLTAALATGRLGSNAAPVPLKLTAGGASLADELAARAAATTPEREAWLRRSAERFARVAAADRLRAPGVTGFQQAVSRLQDTARLSAPLRGAPALSPGRPLVCVEPMPATVISRDDGTGRGLELAAHLLSPAGGDARYVCVVDTGVRQRAAEVANYDGHTDNAALVAANVTNLAAKLAALLAGPSPAIDLDRTLIVLNTEFGRTPYAQGARVDAAGSPEYATTVTARDHWPEAYAAFVLGGPVAFRPTLTGGVWGATDDRGQAVMDSTGAAAAPAMRPQDLRAAIAYAAGVCPFAPDAFLPSDLSVAAHGGSSSESTILTHLRARVFGLV
ncbi:DUF1501 domain-containing protein [Myxococcota bacterium]|nr:DUF1501 domain-containing protein [Myxococcota bacterium]